MSFFIKFANTFDFRRFRENKSRLSSYCPWSMFVGDFKDGVALLKPGALMRRYTFTCPDLGSASAESVNAASYGFNGAVKSLGSGWAVQFEARRALSTAYPGAAWTNVAGWLIDRRRQELFSSQSAHFVNRYYLTLTRNLKSGIHAKTSKLLYKRNEDESEGNLDRAECEKEIRQFMAETDARVSRLAVYMTVEKLDNDQTAAYLRSSVSMRFHSVATPRRPMLLDHFITDDDMDIGSTLKLGAYYTPIVAIRDFRSSDFS